jgi:hypothetical protein
MEQGGPLATMAGTLVRGFGTIAGAAVMVVVGWQFLKVILSGGSERALLNVGKIVLVVGIATAALGNLPAVAELTGLVGRGLFDAVLAAVREATRAPAPV